VQVSLAGGCENSLVSSTQKPPSRPDREHGRVPEGEEVGVYDHYDDARELVNRLLGGGIPARSVSIVGGGVTLVERVIARYGYGRAAFTSALTGSWIGLFAGLLYSTLTPETSLAPLAAGGLIGSGLGMMVGMTLYSTRGLARPRYRSTQQVIASHYRVLVDPEVGGKAKRLANEGGGEA
jgi:hypothetical protein